jgi:uncharacterized protein YjbJ (UPF0337 family)
MTNAQLIQARWTTFLRRVKETWGQLTDDDLALLEGSVEQFVVRVQQKTGEGREAVERCLGALSTRGTCGMADAATIAESGQARNAPRLI